MYPSCSPAPPFRRSQPQLEAGTETRQSEPPRLSDVFQFAQQRPCPVGAKKRSMFFPADLTPANAVELREKAPQVTHLDSNLSSAPMAYTVWEQEWPVTSVGDRNKKRFSATEAAQSKHLINVSIAKEVNAFKFAALRVSCFKLSITPDDPFWCLFSLGSENKPILCSNVHLKQSFSVLRSRKSHCYSKRSNTVWPALHDFQKKKKSQCSIYNI